MSCWIDLCLLHCILAIEAREVLMIARDDVKEMYVKIDTMVEERDGHVP